MEAIDISIYSDENELANSAVIDALSYINTKLEESDECHVALTGGTLGNLIALYLAKE